MRLALIFAVALAVAGCYQPAYISPEPLAAGDYCGSLAITGVYSASLQGVGIPYAPSATLILQGRKGLGAGFDAGVRLSAPGELVWIIPAELYGDIKWNFLSTPCLLTADLGATWRMSYSSDILEHYMSDPISWAVWPSLLIGSTTWYCGTRLMVRHGYGTRFSHPGPIWTVGTGVLVGASFGDRFRVMPQTEALWVPGENLVITLGVNLELHALSREEVEPGWLH
jgi:hypothetical protein